MSNEELKYRISLEDFFSKGLKNAEENAHHFESAVDGIGEHFNELKNQIIGALGVFEAFEFGKEASNEFLEAERNAASLQFTIGQRGGLQKDFEELNEEAEKLGKSSFFDHDTISKAENDLLNFGVSIKQTKDSMQTLTDVGLAKNKSLSEIISEIGNASSSGMTRGLRDYGLGFIKLEKDMSVAGAEARNFQRIIDAMQKTYAGATDSMKDKEFFRIKKMQDEFKEFKEEAGKYLLEAFEQMRPYILKFIEWMKEAAKWVHEHAGMLKNLAIALGTAWVSIKALNGGISIIKGITGAIDVFKNSMGLASEGAGIFSKGISGMLGPLGLIATSIALATEGFLNLKDAIHKANMSAKESVANDKNDWMTPENIEQQRKTTDDLIEYRTKKLVESGKVVDEEAGKYKAILDEIAAAEKQLKANQEGTNKWGETRTQDWYTKHKLEYLQQLKKQIDDATDPSKNKVDVGLGSGLDEPKASKIQQITINLNNAFQNAKFDMQGGGNMNPRDVAVALSELLISSAEDAAMAVTE